jgi:hypothetical protein
MLDVAKNTRATGARGRRALGRLLGEGYRRVMNFAAVGGGRR